MDGPAFVDFRDVWLAYNDELLAQGKFAVEAIDPQGHGGRVHRHRWPSGCGKSTFMKLADGLEPPSRGEIRVAGKTVHGPLKISGMAFQSASLLPWRTTLQNVMLPLEIVEPYRSEPKTRRQEFETRRACAAKAAWAWRLRRQILAAVGGMQQRQHLPGLIHEPQLLLLDEPFGALDAFTREELVVHVARPAGRAGLQRHPRHA